jgi:hypothetical protein
MFARLWTPSLRVLVILVALLTFVPASALARQTASTGQVSLTLYHCPEEMRPETLVAAQCLSTIGPIVEVQLWPLYMGDAYPSTLRDASRDGEAFVWDELPFADYFVQARSLAGGYDRFLIPGLEGLNSPPQLGYTASPNEGYIVPLDATTPMRDLPIYVFRAPAEDSGRVEAGEGSIAVRLHACPAHMRPLDLDAAACPLDPAVANLQISVIGSGEERRDLEDATPQGDALALLSDHSGYALVFLLDAGALPTPTQATLDVYLLR